VNTLVIDVGGTSAKIWGPLGQRLDKIPTGPKFTPENLVEATGDLIEREKCEVISIGYPGKIVNGHPFREPWNLGDGWIDFDYASAFGCPVRIMNDACMQALGSYEGGRMLYLGLGTSFGCTFIVDGTIVPLALGHLKLHNGKSFEECLNRKAFEHDGVERWQKRAVEATEQLKAAFLADYVVLGGGNTKEIEELPPGCRRGGNHNAYFGGIRMWEDAK